MEVKFKYYIAKGYKADTVKAHIIKMGEEAIKKQKTLMRDYGASKLMIQGHTPTAICFDEDVDGKPYLMYYKHYDGKCYYQPNKRYDAGKILAQRMQDAVGFDDSHYACCQFGVSNVAVAAYIGCCYESVAWLRNRKDLLFRIPYSNADDSPLPTIPADFTEITEAEYKYVDVD